MKAKPILTGFLLVLSLGILLPLAYSAKPFAGSVFKTVDEHGNVTFTDTPAKDSNPEEIIVSPVNTQKAVVPPKPEKPPQNSAKSGKGTSEDTTEEEPEEVDYSMARIIQPLDNTTVPPGQLDVVVQIGLKPALQSGHLVKFFHNGQAQGAARSATSLSLTNLNRGEHTVRAEVIDANRKSKAKTQTITFFVKRYVPRKK